MQEKNIKQKKTYQHIAMQTPEEVLHSFGTSLNAGLTNEQVHCAHKQYGFNEIKTHEITWWHVLLHQFTSPFVILLIICTIIAFITKEHIDAIMIGLIVCINGILGFFQEYSAYRTMRLLRHYVSEKVRVKREGQIMAIPRKDLVPGDILLIEQGNIIAADVRLIEADDLMIDESMLTGESQESAKTITTLTQAPEQPFQATNCCFAGTTIVGGSGQGVVFAIGNQTVLGSITTLTAETLHIGVLQENIRRFSLLMLIIIISTLSTVFILHLLIHYHTISIIDLLLFSLALALGITPEALPVVITYALTRGAQKLAKKMVIVKRLSAIEDLGSIEILCVDKTGTLTENKSIVTDIYAAGEENPVILAALASTSWDDRKKKFENPLEAAFWQNMKIDLQNEIQKSPIIQSVAFDPKRIINMVLRSYEGKLYAIARGGYETIRTMSKNPPQKEADAWVEEYGNQGKRIIAIAYKILDDEKQDLEELRDKHSWEFAGITALSDPVKKTAASAVKQAKNMGVMIKIITGDAAEVAGYVGHQIGLIEDQNQIITGPEFAALSEEGQKKAVEKYIVFARIAPEQKYTLVKILEENYEVGYLGDGFNDAPALKIANVGMAVQGASDSAREAADIILLKKSLKVIIDGIEEGRIIFFNIVSYLTIILSSNFGNFYSIAILSLILNHLPLLPLQILLVNLISDITMISLATDIVDPCNVQKPVQFNLVGIIWFAVYIGIISIFCDGFFFWYFSTESVEVRRSNWFVYSILNEIVLIFSLRTKHFFLTSMHPSWQLIITALSSAFITMWLPWSSTGQKLFDLTPIPFGDFIIMLFFVLIFLAANEIAKLIYLYWISKIKFFHKFDIINHPQ